VINRYAPVALWIQKYDKQNEYLLIASPDHHGVIHYSLTTKQGTPLSAEYLGSTFYRERPVVARFNWVDDLMEVVKEHGNILSYHRPERDSVTEEM
jgi:hypothetical protein